MEHRAQCSSLSERRRGGRRRSVGGSCTVRVEHVARHAVEPCPPASRQPGFGVVVRARAPGQVMPSFYGSTFYGQVGSPEHAGWLEMRGWLVGWLAADC